jgi:hypothetical protein
MAARRARAPRNINKNRNAPDLAEKTGRISGALTEGGEGVDLWWRDRFHMSKTNCFFYI